MDFPTKEASVGSWFGFAGGMCTTAQYFEVDGMILDLSNSYWGGWMALMVLQVKSQQYFDKTTWGGIWSSQKNTGARHGKGMAVKVVRKVRDTWEGIEVAFYIALVLGYLPW